MPRTPCVSFFLGNYNIVGVTQQASFQLPERNIGIMPNDKQDLASAPAVWHRNVITVNLWFWKSGLLLHLMQVNKGFEHFRKIVDHF